MSRMLLLILCTCTVLPFAGAQNHALSGGTVSGSLYANPELGFRYEFPSGWVVNDQATQQKEVDAGHQVAWQDDASQKATDKAASKCMKNLLFVTEHPAGMSLTGFDSSAFLAAIDYRCIPGAAFPTAVKDHEAIQRTAKQIESHLRMNTVTAAGPLRLRAFDNGGRVMIEISKSLNISVHEPGGATIQSIHSSILLMQAGSYWVMWWFTSDTDFNLDKLRATKIFFDTESASQRDAK